MSKKLTRREFITQAAVLPAAAPPTFANKPEPTAKPNEWFHRQMWRKTYPEIESTSKANAARLQTWDLSLYPTLYPAHREPNPTKDANHKAALHQIIEELNSDDLEGVYLLARLYALFPDTEGRVQAKQGENWPWFWKGKGSKEEPEEEISPPVQEPKKELTREQWERAISDTEAVLADMRAKHLG